MSVDRRLGTVRQIQQQAFAASLRERRRPLYRAHEQKIVQARLRRPSTAVAPTLASSSRLRFHGFRIVAVELSIAFGGFEIFREHPFDARQNERSGRFRDDLMPIEDATEDLANEVAIFGQRFWWHCRAQRLG